MLREVVEDHKSIQRRREKGCYKTTKICQYMLKKEWYCDICKNGKNYTLAGKSCHLKTRKHVNNIETDDTNILIQPKSMNRKVWLEFIKNDVLFNNTE